MTALLVYLLIGATGSLVALYRNRRFLPELLRMYGTFPMAAALGTMILAAAAAWPVIWPAWWLRNQRPARERQAVR